MTREQQAIAANFDLIAQSIRNTLRGAEPRRVNGSKVAEMPTAPNPFEEEEADRPDPYDAQIETEMEREARNHAGNE